MAVLVILVLQLLSIVVDSAAFFVLFCCFFHLNAEEYEEEGNQNLPGMYLLFPDPLIFNSYIACHSPMPLLSANDDLKC